MSQSNESPRNSAPPPPPAPPLPPAPPNSSFQSTSSSFAGSDMGQNAAKSESPRLSNVSYSEEFDENNPEQKIYRTELTVPINNLSKKSIHKSSEILEREERIRSASLPRAPTDLIRNSKHQDWKQDFQIESGGIRSKLKYFEAEIEKENEGVERNRKQAADLAKYRNQREKSWEPFRHGMYFQGKTCGAFSCQRGGCAGGKNRTETIKKSSTENTERNESAGVVRSSGGSADRNRRVSDESTATTQSLTEAAVRSQALLQSKAAGKIEEIEDADSFRRVLSESGRTLVFVKFYTQKCLPCEKMAKIVRELSIAHPDVKFYQIDVDKEGVQTVLEEVDVAHIPSFYLFKNSKQLANLEGEVNKSELEALISQNI